MCLPFLSTTITSENLFRWRPLDARKQRSIISGSWRMLLHRQRLHIRPQWHGSCSSQNLGGQHSEQGVRFGRSSIWMITDLQPTRCRRAYVHLSWVSDLHLLIYPSFAHVHT